MKYKIKIFILLSVLLSMGVIYLSIKEYREYKFEKTNKEKDAALLADVQQEALKEAQQEIEKLKNESDQSKIQQKAIEQKINRETSKPKDANIMASEPAPYSNGNAISSSDISSLLNGVGEITCYGADGGGGSGSLWKTTSGYHLITNKHVISTNDCRLFIENVGAYKLVEINSTLNGEKDISILSILPWVDGVTPIQNLNYTISNLSQCSKTMPVASPVVIIGFPVYAEKSVIAPDGIPGKVSFRTATEGIISSLDSSVVAPFGTLKYQNYFISAKIDSGNSGGIAISKDSRGLCVLGIPTWLTIGNYETQGLVQNINNIFEPSIFENYDGR